jgi:hypothetical protein
MDEQTDAERKLAHSRVTTAFALLQKAVAGAQAAGLTVAFTFDEQSATRTVVSLHDAAMSVVAYRKL